ncbi:MAG TPA: dihydropteroate synthase [Sphingobacteriaceae bacterium]|nr:dihydropteroate synthase [Sphingobacteriaceae bacterium]
MYKPSQNTTINVKNKILDVADPIIMGIVNLTPDSFFDGGQYNIHEKALKRASQLLKEGATILDVGAYSSRPGAFVVDEEEELERLIPFIERLVEAHPDVIISVDTFRALVAQRAIEAGASIVNDISGGTLDPLMFEIVGKLQVPYVLMHMRGTPETMQDLTEYEDFMGEISAYFIDKIKELRKHGVKDIILDPGFGFAKTIKQNYELLGRVDELLAFGLPILGALSRKSMIYKVLGTDPKHALNGTTALNTILLMKGVNIIRVHDIVEAKEITLLIRKLKESF